jgi:hypothetical protein
MGGLLSCSEKFLDTVEVVVKVEAVNKKKKGKKKKEEKKFVLLALVDFTHLRIDFLPGAQILFVVTSSTLICSMLTTESAATGRPAAIFLGLPKSPNFWPTPGQNTNMISRLNCAISPECHSLAIVRVPLEMGLQRQRLGKELKRPPPLLIFIWQILTLD